MFIGGSEARIIIGPDEAALQWYGEKAERWSHMTFRVTCWSSWGLATTCSSMGANVRKMPVSPNPHG